MAKVRGLIWLLYVCAVASLVLTWMTVVRHARGVETIEGVKVELAGIRAEQRDNKQHIVVRLAAQSTTKLPYKIESIFMVVRRKSRIVAIQPKVHVEVRVSADGVTMVEVETPVRNQTVIEPYWFEPHRRNSWEIHTKLFCQIPYKRNPAELAFELHEGF